MILKTNYEIGQIPHSEHPRPQAKRKNWLCLNGSWDFCKYSVENEKVYDGQILVPFSPETLNSGVQEGFSLQSGEHLLYVKKIAITDNLMLGKTLLHFGAVDSECKIFVNQVYVGGHKGGFTAFTLDITDVLSVGENVIEVICFDEATRNHDARGKQSDKPGLIWYTAQSGIWQTVWLESMPKQAIGKFKITPCAEQKKVFINDLGDVPAEIIVFDGEKEILRKTGVGEIELSYDFELWSPDNPKLYNFLIKNEAGDEVESYFAVRSFGKGYDQNGKPRLLLNGKPFFFNGVLDQGYWSDGMLTYPSDKAAEDEIRLMKDMGFNTLRKHIKIEPMRWYYHCDRLGMIVWQDFVNGGGDYNPFHVAIMPFLGVKHRDDDYKYFSREDESGREAFLAETLETLDQLYNCPCIGVWAPFNEGWGQFDSGKITEMVREKDTTRIIDSVSGWHDQGIGKTELKSLHTYYTPLKVPKDKRPVVLSEFGGYSMKIDGHVYNEKKEFGYKKFHKKQKLETAIEKLYLKKLLPLIEKGLCGCIYTQVSDVEEEINGLVTYDRQIVKVSVPKMKKINKAIDEEAARYY